MNENDREYANKVFNQAMSALTGGFNGELAEEVSEKGLKLLTKELQRAEEAPDEKDVKCPECKAVVSVPLSVTERSKGLSNISAMLDKVVRLGQLVKGQPDGHMKVSGVPMHASVLQGLKPWQFEQVCTWVEENERELEREEA